MGLRNNVFKLRSKLRFRFPIFKVRNKLRSNVVFSKHWHNEHKRKIGGIFFLFSFLAFLDFFHLFEFARNEKLYAGPCAHCVRFACICYGIKSRSDPWLRVLSASCPKFNSTTLCEQPAGCLLPINLNFKGRQIQFGSYLA